MIAPLGVQPSLTVTPLRMLGTAAWQVPSTLTFGVAEQVTTGAVVSVTVNVAVLVTATVAPPHWPLTTTWTAWSPRDNPDVGNVKDGSLAPTAVPSIRHW